MIHESPETEKLAVKILDEITEGKSSEEILKANKIHFDDLKAILNLEGYEDYAEARKDLYIFKMELEMEMQAKEIKPKTQKEFISKTGYNENRVRQFAKGKGYTGFKDFLKAEVL